MVFIKFSTCKYLKGHLKILSGVGTEGGDGRRVGWRRRREGTEEGGDGGRGRREEIEGELDGGDEGRGRREGTEGGDGGRGRRSVKERGVDELTGGMRREGWTIV